MKVERIAVLGSGQMGQGIAQNAAQAGFEVEKRAIRLEDPIKTLGDHAVPVRLHPNVTATLKVSVVKGE